MLVGVPQQHPPPLEPSAPHEMQHGNNGRMTQPLQTGRSRHWLPNQGCPISAAGLGQALAGSQATGGQARRAGRAGGLHSEIWALLKTPGSGPQLPESGPVNLGECLGRSLKIQGCAGSALASDLLRGAQVYQLAVPAFIHSLPIPQSLVHSVSVFVEYWWPKNLRARP